MAATFLESISIAYPYHGVLSAPTARPGALPPTLLTQGLKASSRLQISVSARSAARSRPVRRTIIVCNGQQQDTPFSVPDVTDSAWQSTVLNSDVPVLVEFGTSWCGPCKTMESVLGKLSKDYSGKLKCYKLNTDDNPDIVTEYGIRKIPTMIIFKNGEKKYLVVGKVSESTLVSEIEKFIER